LSTGPGKIARFSGAGLRIALPNRGGFGTEMTRMKKLILFFTMALTAVAARAALPQPDLIAQIHFAGAQKISADKNSAAFTNEFCSVEALALRAQTADKLSVWLAGWLAGNVGAAVPDGATKLRPLLDDLQTAEWFFEARAAVNGRPAAALAIQLDPARARLWQANLKAFFPAASFQSSGAWLIFDSGTGPQKLGASLAQKIAAPPAGWGSADVNWPRLAQWYPKLKALGLPETQLRVTAAEANFHLDGKFFFPENLALNLEPWRVPTNTLHQPFVSFTAARGFAAWLAGQGWAQSLVLRPPVNQVFVWALPQIPFQTFAAVPVPDAAAALRQAYAQLNPVVTNAAARGGLLSSMSLELTNNEIGLRGAPFVAPYLRAVSEPAGQFLLAGGFPNTPRSQPLPPELFTRLATPNLVYYHWEITAERLGAKFDVLPQFTQLGLMLTRHRQLAAESAAFKWMRTISPTLGNTVTEITQTGPAEMTFSRKAPGGLTAAELLALGSWLEAGNFPGCDLTLPVRPKQFKRPHQSLSGAPAPAPVPAH
jgi:hypothetical protein